MGKKRIIAGFLLLFGNLILGCGMIPDTSSMGDVVRPATDFPAMFEAPPGMVLGDDDACNSPMIDPRDQTEIRLVRSWGQGLGDYEVPNGRYGVQSDELLRINCNTGTIMGIVNK